MKLQNIFDFQVNYDIDGHKRDTEQITGLTAEIYPVEFQVTLPKRRNGLG